MMNYVSGLKCITTCYYAMYTDEIVAQNILSALSEI